MSEARSVDPGLVETILKLGPPRNLHDVQSMLGLAKVATEYVPGLSALLAPIQELAKKYLDIPALWAANPLCDIALNDLKAALTCSDVLVIPDITRPFRVAVDACRVGRGLSAVLKKSVLEDDHLPLNDRRWPTGRAHCPTPSATSVRQSSSNRYTRCHQALVHLPVHDLPRVRGFY
jgi:hypothetical protein